MQDDDGTGAGAAPESLLPYDDWTEDAFRQVMVKALREVAANGLPGQHHFYITFRTDDPGTDIPARLRAQYPEEMTIVLQHQFWDLAVDETMLRVGLSFGGVASTLRIPLGAITAFADPAVNFGMRFRARTAPAPEAPAEPEAEAPAAEPPQAETPQVVSLDAFRRRTPPRE